MFALLAQRNYLLLWVAHTFSILGDYIFFIATTYWIYVHTDSASASGTLLIVSTVPIFLCAPLAGLVVDRWPRRRTMLIAESARALLFLSLLATFTAQPNLLWPIYLTAFVQSALAAFFWPARSALLLTLLTPDSLLTSNALYALSDSLVRLIAPTLSTLLLLHLGLHGIILLDAITFLISTLSILHLTLRGTPAQSARSAPTRHAMTPPTRPDLPTRQHSRERPEIETCTCTYTFMSMLYVV